MNDSRYSGYQHRQQNSITSLFAYLKIMSELGSLHFTAVGIYGIILFLSVYNASPWTLGIGYLLFFLVTSFKYLKQMILFSIFAGVLVAVFPPLGIIFAILMVLFLFMKLQFIKENRRPIMAGIAFYGAAFPLYSIMTSFKFYYAFGADKVLSSGLIALAGMTALHCALQWLYRYKYSEEAALGIMGAVPLVIASIILPFMKVYFDMHGAFDVPGVPDTPAADLAHPGDAIHVPASDVAPVHHGNIEAGHVFEGHRGGVGAVGMAGAKAGLIQDHNAGGNFNGIGTNHHGDIHGVGKPFMHEQSPDPGHYSSVGTNYNTNSPVTPHPFDTADHPGLHGEAGMPHGMVNFYEHFPTLHTDTVHTSVAAMHTQLLHGDWNAPKVFVGNDGFAKMYYHPTGNSYIAMHTPDGAYAGDAHCNPGGNNITVWDQGHNVQMRIDMRTGSIMNSQNMQIGHISKVGTHCVVTGMDSMLKMSITGDGQVQNPQGWTVGSLHQA